MTGVLKARTAVGPDVWTAVNGGYINLPAGVTSGMAIQPSSQTTSGTTELTLASFVHTPTVDGTLWVTGGISFTNSVASDAFQVDLKVGGAVVAALQTAGASRGGLTPTGIAVTPVAGGPVTVELTIRRFAGTGTATLAFGRLPWIFIPDAVAGVDYGSLDTRYQRSGAIVSRTYVPPGNIDGNTTGSFTQWFAFTNAINVPTWATLAYVRVDLNRVYMTVAATHSFTIRIGLGTQYTPDLYWAYDSAGAIGTHSFANHIALSAAGMQTLSVQTVRLSGTGTVRIDGTSDVSALVIFF